MLKTVILLAAALSASAADDPWAKVREIKSGTEIRILKKGSVQPLIAKFGELTDENVVIILKNEQTAIARDAVERLDARPQGSRVKRESKWTTHEQQPAVDSPRPSSGPNSSYSSGVSIGDKPDFETVYRRRPAPPPTK